MSSAPSTSPVHASRVFEHRPAPDARGPVLYWMSRDQRVADNWALLHARHLAAQRGAPLGVVFCLAPGFLGATRRHYAFLLAGLREVESRLAAKRVPFFLLRGDPALELPRFAAGCGAAAIVADFDPLRVKRDWQASVARATAAGFVEVDAHNIVPCRAASPRLEFGAYTLRPKIRRALGEFLVEFPSRAPAVAPWPGAVPRVDWEGAAAGMRCDESVGPVSWLTPGERAAGAALRRFVCDKLAVYDERRNDPVQDGQSNLSPYLHFGQLSAQRVALAVKQAAGVAESARESFLEELIVRRELSDNYCFYNPAYDRLEGAPAWARKTLDEHRRDPRAPRYDRGRLEAAQTGEPLWNAAQTELARRGKLHGYMRMYWAKKILEWSATPEEAFETSVYLNDRYELDGRDPNGFVGVAWAVAGVHDRAWGERPVFGKIRYMNAAGCRRKFDVAAYIRRAGEEG